MKVSVSFDDFGEVITKEYEMRRPNLAELSLMMKQAQQQDIIVASKALVLSLMDAAEKQKFTDDLNEYPGVAVAIANKLSASCGLTADVVARKN